MYMYTIYIQIPASKRKLVFFLIERETDVKQDLHGIAIKIIQQSPTEMFLSSM